MNAVTMMFRCQPAAEDLTIKKAAVPSTNDETAAFKRLLIQVYQH
ncbi:hypothetical protein [Paenibacillus herberti]|nr:hypothetical protein [Paenibacillus herberti]